ncbi:DUF3136 domain-containing protein [Synechococcus sp. BA-132 BA5]|uniref:DUF3136 domain-containing protein n=1 Tax=Synechococcus sp. BA-132 BA5 TaxID=3110252 RepID=UPI002B219DC2|nr:DUF3136 domain-containing protein [Synechococcus sp. BA-132 BA5]MEA5414910.1 DUF3136 domain-containing protein [Synechococcus sp. BA-132 BA5]
MRRVRTVAAMSQATFTIALKIGELEASFPLYCKALRILIREEKSIEQIQRSVCWHRLDSRHHCLLRQYKDPNHLYFHLKRELST